MWKRIYKLLAKALDGTKDLLPSVRLSILVSYLHSITGSSEQREFAAYVNQDKMYTLHKLKSPYRQYIVALFFVCYHVACLKATYRGVR